MSPGPPSLETDPHRCCGKLEAYNNRQANTSLDREVTFSAHEHSGKTSLEAAFAKILIDHGIPVRLPPDAQRDDKMALSIDALLATFKEKGVTVMIMESNAT